MGSLYLNDKSLKKRSRDGRNQFLNVNCFIPNGSLKEVTRLNYRNERYEDSPMFNDLEISKINDDLKITLVNNYKIMKKMINKAINVYVVGGDVSYTKMFLDEVVVVDNIPSANIVLFTGGRCMSRPLWRGRWQIHEF